MEQGENNPFRPGFGLVPPHRAGHEEAAKTLAARLRRIRKGSDGDILILHGPRGNGKTALLRELERNAEANGVTVRFLIDSVMREGGTAAAHCLKTGLEMPKPEAKRSGVGLFSAKGDAGFDGASAAAGAQALNALLKKRPVLLVVDEAHAMPAEIGRNLLEVAQLLIGQGMPLLLALAGTPGLISHLRKTGAGFWERSERLRIGKLESDDAARDAFTIPAERGGLSFEGEALDLLVEESKRYPFFLQLLGAAVWDVVVARGGTGKISLEDARAGVARANAKKEDFYLNRIQEADDQGILEEAIAVSKKMLVAGKDSKISNADLMEALKVATAGTGNSPKAARDTLAKLGFIWDNADWDWEPGIPSLCSCFVKHGGNP